MGRRRRRCGLEGGRAPWVLLAMLLAAPASLPADPEPAETETAGAEAVGGEEPETYKNTIRWTTASEVDNFGFDVFRSESEDGPFERLNDRVIEGAGTTDEPRSYQFVDDTIDPRKTYYYYVESISMSGERELFTPIGRAKPKVPPEEPEETEESPPDGG